MKFRFMQEALSIQINQIGKNSLRNRLLLRPIYPYFSSLNEEMAKETDQGATFEKSQIIKCAMIKHSIE